MVEFGSCYSNFPLIWSTQLLRLGMGVGSFGLCIYNFWNGWFTILSFKDAVYIRHALVILKPIAIIGFINIFNKYYVRKFVKHMQGKFGTINICKENLYYKFYQKFIRMYMVIRKMYILKYYQIIVRFMQ